MSLVMQLTAKQTYTLTIKLNLPKTGIKTKQKHIIVPNMCTKCTKLNNATTCHKWNVIHTETTSAQLSIM